MRLLRLCLRAAERPGEGTVHELTEHVQNADKSDVASIELLLTARRRDPVGGAHDARVEAG